MECPECGGVLMGYGAMGSTRDFECLKCGHTTTKRDKEGTYIEREVPDSLSYSDVDGPTAAYNVDRNILFAQFLSTYPTPKYQQ